jgi:hypothetical protein
MQQVVELFDWIINPNTLRGSKKDDNGMWMHTSEKPIFFSPTSRIIELADGKQFLIKKENACKALNMDKTAEKTLNGFISKTDVNP